MIPDMDDKEKQTKKDRTPDQLRRIKAYWIGFSIAFAISVLIAVGTFFLIKDGMQLNYETEKWRIWVDAFTLPGVLFVLAFALVKISDFGAFDAIVYSVRLLWNVTFFPKKTKQKLGANYGEYRNRKMEKPRTSATFLLYIGLGYLLLTGIFLIIYFCA